MLPDRGKKEELDRGNSAERKTSRSNDLKRDAKEAEREAATDGRRNRSSTKLLQITRSAVPASLEAKCDTTSEHQLKETGWGFPPGGRRRRRA